MGPGDSVATTTQARLLFAGDSLLGIPSLFEHVFEVDLFALAEGINPIEVILSDLAGNETRVPESIERAAAALALVEPVAGSALTALRSDLVFEAYADLTIESLDSGGRRLSGFSAIPVSVGPGGSFRLTLQNVPLAPGTADYRIVYRRAGASTSEVLNFALSAPEAGYATVSGQVRALQGGEALGGALVTVVANGSTYVVAAGADGSFSIPVEPGAVTVRVAQQGYLEASYSGEAPAGGSFVADARLVSWTALAGLDASVEPGEDGGELTAAVLSGLVTSAETGEPLAGVRVTAEVDGASFEALSDAEGVYVLGGLPGGEARITLAKEGFYSEAYAQTLAEPDARRTRELHAERRAGDARRDPHAGRHRDRPRER